VRQTEPSMTPCAAGASSTLRDLCPQINGSVPGVLTVLHGIPMTVKESFNVVRLSTTFGNPLWKGTSIAEPRCRVRA
jgi:hypothetical protein